MMYPISLFLFSLFGLYFSYTDIVEGRIPNKAILLFLPLALFVNFKNFENMIWLSLLFGVAFSLYYVEFWRAGDGKLFLVYSLFLLPFIDVGGILTYLLLSISLCFVSLFSLLFYDAIKANRIKENIDTTNQRFLSKKTIILLSFLLFFYLFTRYPEIQIDIIYLPLMVYFIGFCLSLNENNRNKRFPFAPYLFLAALFSLIFNF